MLSSIFEYGEERDSSGNIIRVGTYGLNSQVTRIFQQLITNTNYLADYNLSTSDNLATHKTESNAHLAENIYFAGENLIV